MSRSPLLCHPDRSEAEGRDLQFRGPFLEMFSSVLSYETYKSCGAGDGDRTRNQRLGKPLLYH
jgi:hypothetical protein